MNELTDGEIVEHLIAAFGSSRWSEEPQDQWQRIGHYVLSSLPKELASSVLAVPADFGHTLHRVVSSLRRTDPTFRDLVLGRQEASQPSLPSPPGSLNVSRSSGVVIGMNSGLVAGGNIVAPVMRENRSGAQRDGNSSQTGPGAPIRILFLGASPEDLTRLRLDQEVRQIDQSLRQGEYRDRFNLVSHWAVRPSDLQTCLLRHRPHIVHFSGHGSDTKAICLEDNEGRAQKIEGAVLARLLAVFKTSVRCVVLNACYSAGQAQSIAQDIECVVGMATAVGDQAAIAFSSAFYQALAFGCDVATAFELGCVQIGLDGQLDEENTPRLIALKRNPTEIVFN